MSVRGGGQDRPRKQDPWGGKPGPPGGDDTLPVGRTARPPAFVDVTACTTATATMRGGRGGVSSLPATPGTPGTQRHPLNHQHQHHHHHFSARPEEAGVALGRMAGAGSAPRLVGRALTRSDTGGAMPPPPPYSPVRGGAGAVVVTRSAASTPGGGEGGGGIGGGGGGGSGGGGGFAQGTTGHVPPSPRPPSGITTRTESTTTTTADDDDQDQAHDHDHDQDQDQDQDPDPHPGPASFNNNNSHNNSNNITTTTTITSHHHHHEGTAVQPPIPAPPFVTGVVDAEFNTPRRWAPVLHGDDDRMLLNVGGVRHETHVSTLRAIPNSRLSRLAEMHVQSGGGPQEYFFDRHPAVFNSIIDFYRTGEWGGGGGGGVVVEFS